MCEASGLVFLCLLWGGQLVRCRTWDLCSVAIPGQWGTLNSCTLCPYKRQVSRRPRETAQALHPVL
eukprot:765113-Amphidinium_carterae.1